jgi:hypothetical protein
VYVLRPDINLRSYLPFFFFFFLVFRDKPIESVLVRVSIPAQTS